MLISLTLHLCHLINNGLTSQAYVHWCWRVQHSGWSVRCAKHKECGVDAIGSATSCERPTVVVVIVLRSVNQELWGESSTPSIAGSSCYCSEMGSGRPLPLLQSAHDCVCVVTAEMALLEAVYGIRFSRGLTAARNYNNVHVDPVAIANFAFAFAFGFCFCCCVLGFTASPSLWAEIETLSIKSSLHCKRLSSLPCLCVIRDLSAFLFHFCGHTCILSNGFIGGGTRNTVVGRFV